MLGVNGQSPLPETDPHAHPRIGTLPGIQRDRSLSRIFESRIDRIE
jgi:hypothetical protein